LPALGAEEANMRWRSRCLAGAAALGSVLGSTQGSTHDGSPGLDIFGDKGWEGLSPAQSRLNPPVDYYTRLPGIYARARYNLALTSLQLPQGLNQRHFDVWMAGGLCLTDATPGLELFPEELVRPVRFASVQELPRVVDRLEASGQRQALVNDWRNLLLAEHCYTHRVATVLDIV
jgi:hypothetical protein